MLRLIMSSMWSTEENTALNHLIAQCDNMHVMSHIRQATKEQQTLMRGFGFCCAYRSPVLTGNMPGVR